MFGWTLVVCGSQPGPGPGGQPTTPLLYDYTSVAAVRLYGCTNVEVRAIRLYGCTAIRLYRCEAIRLYRCTGARLYGCTAVRLYGCKFVRLYVCCSTKVGIIYSTRLTRNKFGPLYSPSICPSGPRGGRIGGGVLLWRRDRIYR